jgi:hypothetical protein
MMGAIAPGKAVDRTMRYLRAQGVSMDEIVSRAMWPRRYRRASGLSGQVSAERSRVSAWTVGDLERGLNHRPPIDHLTLLVGAVHLPDRERARLA